MNVMSRQHFEYDDDYITEDRTISTFKGAFEAIGSFGLMHYSRTHIAANNIKGITSEEDKDTESVEKPTKRPHPMISFVNLFGEENLRKVIIDNLTNKEFIAYMFKQVSLKKRYSESDWLSYRNEPGQTFLDVSERDSIHIVLSYQISTQDQQRQANNLHPQNGSQNHKENAQLARSLLLSVLFWNDCKNYKRKGAHQHSFTKKPTKVSRFFV